MPDPTAHTAMANRPDTSTINEWITCADLTNKANQLAASFRFFGDSARHARISLQPLPWQRVLIAEIENGSAIGRKRRARRARCRRRYAH